MRPGARGTWAAGLANACENALLLVLALLMVGIVALNVANVLGRYVFYAPVPGADELMTFGMVWGVFLGAGVVTLRGAHLNMDLVLGLLPPPLKRAAQAAATVTMIVALGFVALQSVDYIETVGAIGLTSMALGLPMAWVHAAVPAGMVVMILAALLRLAAARA
jgi:TRAP-type C4-dicarboxylate transport system permease small subunit